MNTFASKNVAYSPDRGNFEQGYSLTSRDAGGVDVSAAAPIHCAPSTTYKYASDTLELDTGVMEGALSGLRHWMESASGKYWHVAKGGFLTLFWTGYAALWLFGAYHAGHFTENQYAHRPAAPSATAGRIKEAQP